MAKTVATQLFLICAVAASLTSGHLEEPTAIPMNLEQTVEQPTVAPLTLEQVVERYQPYRSPILKSLSDFTLSDTEAFDKIGEKINELLGVSPENKDFWLLWLTKEVSYNTPQVTSDDAKALLEDVQKEAAHITAQLLDVRKRADPQATLAVAKESLTALTDRAVDRLVVYLKNRLRYDLRNFQQFPTNNMIIEADLASAMEVASFLAKTTEDIFKHETLNLPAAPKLFKALSQKITDLQQTAVSFSYKMAELLNLITGTTTAVRTEAEHLFFLAQTQIAVLPERRDSRLNLVNRLMVLVSKNEKSHDSIKELFSVFKQYDKGTVNFSHVFQTQGEVEHPHPVIKFQDPEFEVVFRVMIQKFLTEVHTLILPSLSIKLASDLFLNRFLYAFRGIEPFLLSYEGFRREKVANSGMEKIDFAEYQKSPEYKESLKTLPIFDHLSNTKAALIGKIIFLTIFGAKEQLPEWWGSVLPTIHELMTVELPSLEALTFLNIEVWSTIIPFTPESQEFLASHLEVMLNFLASEGPSITDPRDAYLHFDRHLDSVYDAQPVFQRFWGRSKILNIYVSDAKRNFMTTFAKPVSEEDLKALTNPVAPKNAPKDANKDAPKSPFRPLIVSIYAAYDKEENLLEEESQKRGDNPIYKSLASVLAGKSKRVLKRIFNGQPIDSSFFKHVEITKADVPINNAPASLRSVKVATRSTNFAFKMPEIASKAIGSENKITLDNGSDEPVPEDKKDQGNNEESEPVKPIDPEQQQELNELEARLVEQVTKNPSEIMDALVEEQSKEAAEKQEIRSSIIKTLNEAEAQEAKGQENSEDPIFDPEEVKKADEDNIFDPQQVKEAELEKQESLHDVDESSPVEEEKPHQEDPVAEVTNETREGLVDIDEEDLLKNMPKLVRGNEVYEEPVEDESDKLIDLTSIKKLESIAEPEKKSEEQPVEEPELFIPLPELKRTDQMPRPQSSTQIHPANNYLTPKELALLQMDNLEGVLKELNELVDEDGNVTTFVMVKLIPKTSDCFQSLFAQMD